MGKIVLEEEISIRITKKEITIFIKDVSKKIDNVRNEFIKKSVSSDKRMTNIEKVNQNNNIRIEILEKVYQNYDRRIEVLEKANQNLTLPLNFYIDDCKASMFKANLYMLWKKENYVTWIDDLDNIRHIDINDRYGSLAHIFKLIISHIDHIHIHHKKLQVRLKHDLAIILGFNIDDYKSYKTFKNAYYNAIDDINKM